MAAQEDTREKKLFFVLYFLSIYAKMKCDRLVGSGLPTVNVKSL